MPAFRYKARTVEGRVHEGSIEAENENAARATLRGRKLTVLELGKAPTAGVFRRGPKVAQKDVVTFSRQLATMVGGGLPIAQSLSSITEQTESKGLASILTQVRDDITSGVTIADALNKHPAVFDNLYVNMVKAGESSGSLEVVLDRLSTYLEKAEALKGKIKSAMMYPAAIAFVAIGVVFFLMVQVIPSFKDVFGQFGAELPLPTKILIGISEFLQSQYYLIIGGVGALFGGLIVFRRTEFGARATDALLLKLPVFGILMRKFTVARFTRTLGTLQRSGVPILESMEIVAKTAGNKVVEEAILKARISMREGEGVARPLKETGVFPPMVIQMMAVGEETGKIEEMLIKIADFYDQEVDTAVDGLLKLIEPVMMVVMGLTVGVIVLGMFMPMFEMSSMAG